LMRCVSSSPCRKSDVVIEIMRSRSWSKTTVEAVGCRQGNQWPGVGHDQLGVKLVIWHGGSFSQASNELDAHRVRMGGKTRQRKPVRMQGAEQLAEANLCIQAIADVAP
jgi:hypothetical protein